MGAHGDVLQSHLELVFTEGVVSDREGAVEGIISVSKRSESSEAAGREVCPVANLVYLGVITLLGPLEI